MGTVRLVFLGGHNTHFGSEITVVESPLFVEMSIVSPY